MSDKISKDVERLITSIDVMGHAFETVTEIINKLEVDGMSEYEEFIVRKNILRIIGMFDKAIKDVG